MSQTIKISDELHEAIRKRAELEQRPMATVVGRAFRTYLAATRHPIEGSTLADELSRFVEETPKRLQEAVLEGKDVP